MKLSKCEVCGNTIGADNGTEWLKVQLAGVKNKHFIYIKEYICECGNKNYVTTKEEST